MVWRVSAISAGAVWLRGTYGCVETDCGIGIEVKTQLGIETDVDMWTKTEVESQQNIVL